MCMEMCAGMTNVNLFVYGSLMFDEVWSQLVCGDYLKLPARLHGFMRRRVVGDVYPVIVRSHRGDWVDGIVYFGVGPEDMTRLDLFEADPYDRQTHLVLVEGREKRRADVYVLKDDYRYMVHDSEWDPQWFEQEGLPLFIRRYRGFQR